jgi:hypothetical protein
LRGFFATRPKIACRGVFRDVEELIEAIETYIERHNQSPKAFIWTARATDILEKVKRARTCLRMSLRIRFINRIDYEPALALGEITLDDFVETFETPLTFWSADRYENQWREGIDRLLKEASRSCLITSMLDPKTEVFGVWWKLYRDGDQVVVQNQMLLSDVFGKNFDADEPYRSIPDRLSVNADGEPVAEWFLKFDKIGPL